MHPSGSGLSLRESVERFRCTEEQQHSPWVLQADPSQPGMTPASSRILGDLETCQKAGVKREGFLLRPELQCLKTKQQQQQSEGAERKKRNLQEFLSNQPRIH